MSRFITSWRQYIGSWASPLMLTVSGAHFRSCTSQRTPFARSTKKSCKGLLIPSSSFRVDYNVSFTGTEAARTSLLNLQECKIVVANTPVGCILLWFGTPKWNSGAKLKCSFARFERKLPLSGVGLEPIGCRVKHNDETKKELDVAVCRACGLCLVTTCTLCVHAG